MLPAPFTWDGPHIAAALPGARVLFTTRRGGVSQGPYSSLNLGRLTQDTDANVDANRDLLAQIVGHPRERFLYGRQVHGTTVSRATQPMQSAAEQDGQATNLPGSPALVFTADCLAILLAAEGAVAAIHAGWRGLAGGIVEAGVRAARELGATGPIHAALGPAAGGCCYEVGEEVHAHFAHHDARRNTRNLDLKRIAADQLAAAGVHSVHDVGLCTLCGDPALFFSHRRDHGVTGRQAGIVWRA